ncbi:hypothetical protein [Segniliparus rugosus]|uniref:Uncharacterized protein n=1 Tax=Segniliparus rugosus (strain ATCC BAA-974 / DSM 45345 / CCUG 50838 / CIP 108380 / JCM 13579 / CDC 945) TaxID=679197 RepID=E5XTZ5_SEGRC|nr:hypothetical protein [Segniliparus rugosus]EFV12164.1 hypothetical protein HMPREF9336_02967 [Segniliparus rugosus ATCC BAA-974]
MPRLSRHAALTALAALAPALLSPIAPQAVAEPNPDCVVLRQAAGQYSKLADHFASLRKVAGRQGSNPDQHAEVKRQLVQQARTMADMLRDLSEKLTSQDLKNLYWEDAQSFDEYADSVDTSLGTGNENTMYESYNRNVKAVKAANKAFHEQCK